MSYYADLENAEIVLRVPYKQDYTYEPVIREFPLTLIELIKCVADNIEAHAFDREDSVSVRASTSPYFYFENIPDHLETEEEK